MIKEKITGNKKNLTWWRKRLMNDTQIELISISDLISVKEALINGHLFRTGAHLI